MRADNKTAYKDEDRRRFREILSVLRRRRLLSGITPEKLLAAFEELGPTFVKVGQILSMRPDIIPPEYCEAFQRLRTDVAPMPTETAQRVIEEEFGCPIGEVFSEFDGHCLGSASIAQVHRAKLLDGATVVVKVQRPDIEERMRRDVNLCRRFARFVKKTPLGEVFDLNMVLDEMWETAQQEMDFLTEAAHLEEFRQKNADVVYVYCPKVYEELTSKRVLVMEYIDGIRIDDVDALREHGYDTDEIGQKLASNYIKQVIDDRYFHADPHPGNIYVRDGKIVWLDMGMMGRMSETDAQYYKNGIAAVVRKDCEEIKDIVMALGACRERVDENRMVQDFQHFLNRYGAMPLEQMNLGRILNEAIDLARAYKVSMPAGMTMMARGVMNLEGVLEIISPSVSVISVLAKRQAGSALEDIDLRKSAVSLARDLLASGQGLTRLPGQLSTVLSRIENNRLKMNLELTGSEEPLKRLDLSVKKLSGAVLSGGLILGALLLRGARPEDPLATVCLIAGVLLGAWSLLRRKNK